MDAYRNLSPVANLRSEEHTSELQSPVHLHSFPTRRSSDLSFVYNLAHLCSNPTGSQIITTQVSWQATIASCPVSGNLDFDSITSKYSKKTSEPMDGCLPKSLSSR